MGIKISSFSKISNNLETRSETSQFEILGGFQIELASIALLRWNIILKASLI